MKKHVVAKKVVCPDNGAWTPTTSNSSSNDDSSKDSNTSSSAVHPSSGVEDSGSSKTSSDSDDKPPPPPVPKATAKAKPPPPPKKDEEKHDWLICDTPLAIFKLDPYKLSIGCHCKKHVNCHPNRVVDKQPIGYFMAWLSCADDPAYDTRDKHFAARLDRHRDDSPLSYEKREAGRRVAENDPAYALVMSWEVPQNGAEPRNV